MSQFPNALSRRPRRLMLKGSLFRLCPDPSSPQHKDLKPDPQLVGRLSQCRVLGCKKGHREHPPPLWSPGHGPRVAGRTGGAFPTLSSSCRDPEGRRGLHCRGFYVAELNLMK